MSNVEEERFENYLKSFQPRYAEPLPDVHLKHEGFRAPFTWAAAAALGGLMIVAGIHDWRRGNEPPVPAVLVGKANTGPLTLRQVNDLFRKSDSLTVGLDEVAWKSSQTSVGRGQQSALAVLGKEKL